MSVKLYWDEVFKLNIDQDAKRRIFAWPAEQAAFDISVKPVLATPYCKFDPPPLKET